MNDNYNQENFIQANSPDGGFLQSEEWRKFQESTGKKTFHIEQKGFWANIIEHQLPLVGKYFYIPRGPIIGLGSSASLGMKNIIDLAKKEKFGWIRIEPANEELLEIIRNSFKSKIVKAPHDMQPKEILFLDIKKSEEDLLSEMKQKTRYNLRLSQKHGVSVNSKPGLANSEHIDKFIELVRITARRDKITPHPDSYYRKMFETIPGDILKLYVAEYENEVIAANSMIFYGKTATYLHGASDDKFRNVMAPYLLQWQAIKDAKTAGYANYDFGGINTRTGEGITKFKTGFAPNSKPVEFTGSWDIVISPVRYSLYRLMQNTKSLFK